VEPLGELMGDGVETFVNSCLGCLRGLGLAGISSVLLGLFCILLGFFFKLEFGIQVKIRVGTFV
jgi:hypothetical protein